MEFYKLAGIGDIGEIIAYPDISPEHDKRGVVGLGEPPAIGVVAAIGNAVANAVGTRVSTHRSLRSGYWLLSKGGMRKCKTSNTQVQQRYRKPRDCWVAAGEK
jgi:hypothetical protein